MDNHGVRGGNTVTRLEKQMEKRVEQLLIRPVEAAAMLSISKSKIYELLADGRVRSVRIGGCLRIPRAALERLAEAGDEAS